MSFSRGLPGSSLDGTVLLIMKYRAMTVLDIHTLYRDRSRTGENWIEVFFNENQVRLILLQLACFLFPRKQFL